MLGCWDAAPPLCPPYQVHYSIPQDPRCQAAAPFASPSRIHGPALPVTQGHGHLAGTGWGDAQTPNRSAWDDLDGTYADYVVVYESDDGPVTSRRWEA